MASGSNIDRLPTLEDGLEGPSGNLTLEDSLRTELELILRAQPNQQTVATERDLNIFRSGSAPPTVDGSLSAVGSLFRNPDFRHIHNSISNGGPGGSINDGILSEDEIRSHPAYLSYYYSHESINPRLPPPLLSKEDWRVARRFQDGGMSSGVSGDWQKKGVDSGDTSSLFSMQPALSVQQAENELMEVRNVSQRNMAKRTSAEWLGKGSDGLIGLNVPGLGSRRKSFADILQEGLDRPNSSASQLSRPASCNAFGELVDTSSLSPVHRAGLSNGIDSFDILHSSAARSGMVGLPSQKTPHFFTSDVGSSLSRSTTPELQLGGRSSGSGIRPVGSRVSPVEKKGAFGLNAHNDPSRMSEIPEIAAKLSALSLSKLRQAEEDSQIQSQPKLTRDNQPNLMFSVPNGHKQSLEQQSIGNSNMKNPPFSSNYIDFIGNDEIVPNRSASMVNSNGQINIPKRTSSLANLRMNMNSAGVGSVEGASGRHQNANIRAFTGGDGQSLNGLHNHVGLDRHSQAVDPHYVRYLGRSSDYATRDVASGSDPSDVRKYLRASHGDLEGLQKAYIEALLVQQQQQYELQLLGKSGDLNHGYYASHPYGLGMPYPGNLMANPVVPSVGSGCFQNEQNLCFSPMMRSSVGGPVSWQSDAANNMGVKYMSSLLDEFKTNKTRSFELSDIVDHVVEFSTDQHGSRFIQQKLEAATLEEKTKIFPEIIPHARTLMTDVFGNYVIQKFFEHGTESQRAQLASQLIGHVLRLSLQMYGCRVIQKALEVVNVDQQTQMVAELDGSVTKCVHDQNGNHVIQKCIECVPQDRIQFIISAFYGQVVALSTHPYGCRVIQRVLEHCDDVNTQQTIMDEVMQCVCDLAQDQYGNYVIQHVLEHGKPHERSAIINKLAGQIIRMSQQKFASNVVEKCLSFGSPEERQILVNEMLCSSDGNEPLQAMMKDPFGNYVVQKVLETCDDKSLEIILSRIKIHLTTLKKYTYGKHIVSRIEKLVTTGERRIGLSASSVSS